MEFVALSDLTIIKSANAAAEPRPVSGHFPGLKSMKDC
jgi:hypothetical protein